MAPAATITFKRLASLLVEKRQQEYNKTIAWIRCQLRFSLVRSSVMCLRGARSLYHCPARPDCDIPLDVALVEGHVPTDYIKNFGHYTDSSLFSHFTHLLMYFWSSVCMYNCLPHYFSCFGRKKNSTVLP